MGDYTTVYTDKWTAIRSVVSVNERRKLAEAMLDYGCLGIEPAGLSKVAQAFFDAIKTSLVRTRRGAPEGNQNASKNKSENNSKTIPKTISENKSENNSENNSKNNSVTTPTPTPTPYTTPNKKEKDKEKRSASASPAVRFIKPTLEQIRDYIKEKGYHFDADAFFAFYESKGWKVGNQPMRSWQAACVTWEKRCDVPYEPKKQEEHHLSECLVCHSQNLIRDLDRYKCRKCGLFWEYNSETGKWEALI